MELLAQCMTTGINVSSILNFFQFVLKCDMLLLAVLRSCSTNDGAEGANLIELNAKTYATAR